LLPAQTNPAASGSIGGRVKNSATDQYLGNVKVAIAGTNLLAFTATDGSYSVVDVPAGTHELLVSYTGLDPQRISIEISPGAAVERNIELTSAARYGASSSLVKLDPYVVTTDTELNAQAVATNEQRYAANIKSALATDSFGSVMANSVGEFMKFIPGVTVSNAGNSNEITEFAVRGIGGAMSSFTQDGAPQVFGSYARSSRIFNPYTSDLNTTARIEVTKVPTPSTPADSIGGSVNLVSKSVFDNDKAVGRFNVGLNASGRFIGDTWWKESPTTLGDRTNHKVLPSVSFDYSRPFSKKFGVFVSFLHFPKASLLNQFRTVYQSAGTATGATLANPYMQSLFELEGPRTFTKTNFSARADWRVSPHSVLSLSVAAGTNKTLIGNSYRAPDAGATGTPSIAGGVPLTWGPDFTSGATGRGNVQLVALFQEFNGASTSPSIAYRLDDGRWRIEARLNQSKSYMEKDNPGGPFSQVIASLRVPVRVSFRGSGEDGRPDVVQVLDNTNNPVDISNPANYRIDSGQEIFYRNKARADHADLKLNRRLSWFSFPASVETGGVRTVRDYENRGWVRALTYNGPDGDPATADPIPSSFLMQSWRNRVLPMAGGGTAPFLSPDRIWAQWEATPNLFTRTPAQIVAEETNRRQTAQNIEETVTAAYLQGDARLLSGRLTVLTGVRFEKTDTDGAGLLFDPNAVFVRNPDGTFARNAAGARLRRTDAGAAGSLEELNLTRKENGASAQRSYHGYYPSFHATYTATEQFLVRGAYARTFGRPDYLQIIPGTTVQEADLSATQAADPNAIRGNITVSNTGLKPWTADNFDLSLEYYSKTGGLLTGGVFLKNITDFFGASSRVATQANLDELGLGSQYVGWLLNTRFNVGDARIKGVEFNFRQPLSGLGTWGRFFSVFANGTRIWLEGDRQADFSNFTTKSANWGVSFGRKRIYAGLKWNYRGFERRTTNPSFGPDGNTYFTSAVTMDVDLSYSLTPRLNLAVSATNVFDQTVVWHAYGPQTPVYARRFLTFGYGAHYAFAVKGTF
jgi:TonB-dependent receptor